MPEAPTVLLVCVHNAGRSQMAAGFLQSLAGDRVTVLSAGSEPKDRVNPVAVEAMAEEGIDITSNQPKVLTTEAVRDSDVVITMGCGDACPIFPGKRYEDWDLADPAGLPIDEVRPIRDDIRARVEHHLGEILPAGSGDTPEPASVGETAPPMSSCQTAVAPLWPMSTACTTVPPAATRASTMSTTAIHRGTRRPAGTAASPAAGPAAGPAADTADAAACARTARFSYSVTASSSPATPTSPITHGSSPSASSACCSMRSFSPTRCSSFSPDSVETGTSTRATSARAIGRYPAHRLALGQSAVSSTSTAAAGTITSVACTMKGWRGRPKKVSNMGSSSGPILPGFLDAAQAPIGMHAVSGR